MKVELFLDFLGFIFSWYLVILLRCNNTELYDRLKSRVYSDKKITENIDCEIMEVISKEVRDSYKEDIIVELKSEKIEDMEDNLDKIINILENTN